MGNKLTNQDREFLKRIGIGGNGYTPPEATPENGPTFSPEDMQKRGERLKATGKMPSLADVLKIVREEEVKHEQAG